MHDMEIEGNILHQFKTIMNFFTRNLRKIQVEKEFNSLGQLEIQYESLTEYVVNALVHRSLNIKSPIRIFIFDDRVEIHSPGSLPNGLTVEDIKNGTSMPRNTFMLFIFSPILKPVVESVVLCSLILMLSFQTEHMKEILPILIMSSWLLSLVKVTK